MLSVYVSVAPVIEDVTDVQCIEATLYSDKLRTAGTVDCIALYKNVLSVLDWKTSKKEKYRHEIHSYFIQCAAYAFMFHERTGLTPEKIVVVMSVDNSNTLVFEENTSLWFPKFVEIRKKYSK